MGLEIGRYLEHIGQRVRRKKETEQSAALTKTRRWMELIDRRLSGAGLAIPRYIVTDPYVGTDVIDYVTVIKRGPSLSVVFYDPPSKKDTRLAIVVQQNALIRLASQKSGTFQWQTGIGSDFPLYTEADVLFDSFRKLQNAKLFDHSGQTWHGQVPAIGDVLSALQPSA